MSTCQLRRSDYDFALFRVYNVRFNDEYASVYTPMTDSFGVLSRLQSSIRDPCPLQI